VWTIRTRRFSALGTFAAVTAGATLVVELLAPGMTSRYLTMVVQGGALTFVNATLPSFLRFAVGGGGYTLFVPLALAAVGVARYATRIAERTLPALFEAVVPLSILLAPYGWGHDYLAAAGVAAAGAFRPEWPVVVCLNLLLAAAGGFDLVPDATFLVVGVVLVFLSRTVLPVWASRSHTESR
jgi:hypothetical protein